MEVSRFLCDVCGAEKGDANHWLVVRSGLRFTATSWKMALDEGDVSEAQHICGQECLHKRLSQWLESISRPAPANEGGNQ